MKVEGENFLGASEQKTEALRISILDKLENIRNSDKVKSALDLALSLHSDQRPRPDGPYVDHLLRCVNRLLDFGVTDPDILIASALHDSIEDQSQLLSDKLSEAEELDTRNRARIFLEKEYGQRASNIINSVTNLEELDDLDFEERIKTYYFHVKQVIEDPDSFYVKLSDFMDNGLRLSNITDTKRRIKLAKKYLPLFHIFVERIKQDDIAIDQKKKDEIIGELLREMSVARKSIE